MVPRPSVRPLAAHFVDQHHRAAAGQCGRIDRSDSHRAARDKIKDLRGALAYHVSSMELENSNSGQADPVPSGDDFFTAAAGRISRFVLARGVLLTAAAWWKFGH